MQTCPHLRALLRHLAIWQSGSQVEEQLQWIRILPEDTLRILHYFWSHNKPHLSVFDAPAVRTITQLDISGDITPAIAKACLSLPSLQTLCITFYNTASYDCALEVTPSPSLKHLVVIMIYQCSFTYRFLAVCAPQLSTLALLPAVHFMDNPGATVVDTLLACTGQLTEFSLFGWGAWSPARPFMDDLVLRNPALERVCCLEGTYSEQLFQHLPATLRVLELATGVAPYPYERALLDYIARVGEEGLGLRRLCLLMSCIDEEPWAHIAESCKKSGVEFSLDVHRETLYKARGREWCA
ncbi:hypothetical protein K466DRAFT_591172 [Polyporus arcularius HHB13444]|uniref:F-box domain-containing protein n=1 Tax=Polyporus arcularius HHB13444 TaxID=1314778 RepID=A0A5C3NW57_9APHY|nr:hypothetical protein K466DRAFT_591172 [Polyporus arcularius HHB13444]